LLFVCLDDRLAAHRIASHRLYLTLHFTAASARFYARVNGATCDTMHDKQSNRTTIVTRSWEDVFAALAESLNHCTGNNLSYDHCENDYAQSC